VNVSLPDGLCATLIFQMAGTMVPVSFARIGIGHDRTCVDGDLGSRRDELVRRLEVERSACVPDAPSQVERALQYDLDIVEQELGHIRSESEAFQRDEARVSKIMRLDGGTMRPKSSQMYNMLYALRHTFGGAESKGVRPMARAGFRFVETNFCENPPCVRSKYIFNEQESLMICPSCSMTKCAEYVTNNMNHPSRSQTRYDRSRVCQKYLDQFHDGVRDPPKSVINGIYNELSRQHTLVSSFVREGVILSILKKLKLNKWKPFSQRIRRIVNGEKIPKMSRHLIQLLMKRFRIVISQKLSHNNRKLLNLDFLTRQFLLMEGKPMLASMFNNHKTANVIQKADVDMIKLYKDIRGDTELEWSFYSSY